MSFCIALYGGLSYDRDKNTWELVLELSYLSYASDLGYLRHRVPISPDVTMIIWRVWQKPIILEELEKIPIYLLNTG